MTTKAASPSTARGATSPDPFNLRKQPIKRDNIACMEGAKFTFASDVNQKAVLQTGRLIYKHGGQASIRSPPGTNYIITTSAWSRSKVYLEVFREDIDRLSVDWILPGSCFRVIKFSGKVKGAKKSSQIPYRYAAPPEGSVWLVPISFVIQWAETGVRPPRPVLWCIVQIGDVQPKLVYPSKDVMIDPAGPIHLHWLEKSGRILLADPTGWGDKTYVGQAPSASASEVVASYSGHGFRAPINPPDVVTSGFRTGFGVPISPPDVVTSGSGTGVRPVPMNYREQARFTETTPAVVPARRYSFSPVTPGPSGTWAYSKPAVPYLSPGHDLWHFPPLAQRIPLEEPSQTGGRSDGPSTAGLPPRLSASNSSGSSSGRVPPTGPRNPTVQQSVPRSAALNPGAVRPSQSVVAPTKQPPVPIAPPKSAAKPATHALATGHSSVPAPATEGASRAASVLLPPPIAAALLGAKTTPTSDTLQTASYASSTAPVSHAERSTTPLATPPLPHPAAQSNKRGGTDGAISRPGSTVPPDKRSKPSIPDSTGSALPRGLTSGDMPFKAWLEDHQQSLYLAGRLGRDVNLSKQLADRGVVPCDQPDRAALIVVEMIDESLTGGQLGTYHDIVRVRGFPGRVVEVAWLRRCLEHDCYFNPASFKAEVPGSSDEKSDEKSDD